MIKSLSERMEQFGKIRKNKDYEVPNFEHGAHFKYRDLQRKLLDLVETFPLERLGNNGIYFQEEDEKEIEKPSSYFKSEPNVRQNAFSILKSLRLSTKPVMYTPKKTIQFIQKDKMKMNTKQAFSDYTKKNNSTIPLFHYNNTIAINKSSLKVNESYAKLPDLKKHSSIMHLSTNSKSKSKSKSKNQKNSISSNINLPLIKESKANNTNQILMKYYIDKSIGKNGLKNIISSKKKKTIQACY